MTVDEHTVDLASARVFYRSAPARTTSTTVFVHGVPTSADVWEPVLERTGGVALDLPGFGRSDKGGHLDYSVGGLAQVTAELIDRLEIDNPALVGHGWGALVAAEVAARRPTARLILINPIAPDLPWPRVARVCRTRGLGELTMGALTRWTLARLLRRGGPWSNEQIERLWAQFDQGTQRATLRLHRGATSQARPDVSTLVVYGEQDPWLGSEHAQRVAAQLPQASVHTVGGAGHWPWLERPDAIASILEP